MECMVSKEPDARRIMQANSIVIIWIGDISIPKTSKSKTQKDLDPEESDGRSWRFWCPFHQFPHPALFTSLQGGIRWYRTVLWGLSKRTPELLRNIKPSTADFEASPKTLCFSCVYTYCDKMCAKLLIHLIVIVCELFFLYKQRRETML